MTKDKLIKELNKLDLKQIREKDVDKIIYNIKIIKKTINEAIKLKEEKSILIKENANLKGIINNLKVFISQAN
ncbi:hypothetical protein [Clostridium tyrobutyricum]|uniref:hypothetical protein n=1 Tax=Clostridium tyrobutyricum TaxID=1519 RepID=UPI001C38C051|nr:hypothetical protein [Clostridium tyrobutyricum]MBV4423602.1 hypothetical protein [Clostridium tyrobutyricum]